MASMAYRVHFFFMLLGNLVYLIIIWFLWKAIYGDSTNMRGLSFIDTFSYLALAMSLFILMQCWTEWAMADTIISGNIMIYFLRPIDYQLQLFFDVFGFMLSNFVTTLLPTWLVLVFGFHVALPLDLRVIIFGISLLFAFIISFCIDYLVGIMAFYTQSIWGLSMTKEVIVLLLSGALIPLTFFPPTLQNWVNRLPFQAIYNLPLSILLHDFHFSKALRILGVQLFWTVVLIILSRFVFSRAVRILTINGG